MLKATVSDNMRSVQVKPYSAVLGCEGDVDVRCVRWDVPRYSDGYDMSKCRLQVHFENALGETDVSEALDVDIGDERMEFTWRPPYTATKKQGKVMAGFKARELDGYKIVREFNSVPAKFDVRPAENGEAKGGYVVDEIGNRFVFPIVCIEEGE